MGSAPAVVRRKLGQSLLKQPVNDRLHSNGYNNNTSQSTAKLLEKIRAIYRDHCPYKTEKEVESVLMKYAGKEAELLPKAHMKYACKAAQKALSSLRQPLIYPAISMRTTAAAGA